MKLVNIQKGFTLIELAIVLVIIGMLAGSFISTLSSRIDNARIAESNDELSRIKNALYGYAMSQATPYLPCPDCRSFLACPGGTPNNGVEDRTVGGSCSTGNAVGNVPWITLGLGSEDTWGNRYRYWADNTFARNDTTFSLTDAGNGIVQKRNNDGTATVDIATNVVAVIFSHGKNGYGAINSSDVVQAAIPAGNVDELDNADNNANFVTRPQTDEDSTTDGGAFDDIMVWISEFELKAKMVEAGALPP